MDIYFQEKRVWLSVHAIKQARKRVIYPDMILATIQGGKVKRFGKNMLKFMKRYKRGTVICIGEIVGQSIVIRTIEWGN